MIKTLIVDDERHCRESLRNILQTYCEDVDVIDVADSVDSAYEKIITLKPELVFLDIVMPPTDGFALLNKFKSTDFEVVFTTAHDQFALQAIKHSALDYVLKPVNISEIVNAVEKVKNRMATQLKSQPVQRIALATKESIMFMEPSLIVHLESGLGHKTVFYLKNNKQITVNKDLSDYESILKPFRFFRPHRSHIINCLEVREYVPDRSGGCAIMTDGKIVPVAPKRKEEFLSIFGAG